MLIPIMILVIFAATLIMGIRTHQMLRKMDEARKPAPPKEEPEEEPEEARRPVTADDCWPPVQPLPGEEETPPEN